MTELCFLAVKTVNKTSRAIKEFALLTVNTETLEPLSDVHYRVDDPETAHSEGGTGEGELGGSLDEALAGAATMIDGVVLAGFSVSDHWYLLEDAYERQGIRAPKPESATLDLQQLAWPMRLSGKVAWFDDFWELSKALGVPVRTSTQGQVYAASQVLRRLNERAQLGTRLDLLNDNERSIALTAVARLELGRKNYGPWEVNDGRDNAREALEEAIDGFMYCAAELVRLEDGHRDTLPVPEPQPQAEQQPQPKPPTLPEESES